MPETGQPTLAATWAAAERLFPISERYGIDVSRHAAGFYVGQVVRRFGDNGPYRIIGYCTSEAGPGVAVEAACRMAMANLAAGKDWMGGRLPELEAA